MKKFLAIIVVCIFACMLCMGANAEIFEKGRAYAGFSDVPYGTWYYKDVEAVYQMSLMDGMPDGTFGSDGNMSVAQAITIAARIHSTYYGKTIHGTGGSWYTAYVEYAINNDIIRRGDFDDYTRPILSHEMIKIFAHCLPHSYYKAINNIEKIPDVSKFEGYHDEVLLFYKAGILTGDEKGNFLPDSTITRKRAASIIARTVISKQRATFEAPEIPKIDISRHLNKYVANVNYWDTQGRAYVLIVTPTASSDIFTVEMRCVDVKDVSRQAKVIANIDIKDESCSKFEIAFDNDLYHNNGKVRIDFSGDQMKFEVLYVKHNMGGSGKWGFFNSNGTLVPIATVISDYEKILDPTIKPVYDGSYVSITKK